MIKEFMSVMTEAEEVLFMGSYAGAAERRLSGIRRDQERHPAPCKSLVKGLSQKASQSMPALPVSAERPGMRTARETTNASTADRAFRFGEIKTRGRYGVQYTLTNNYADGSICGHSRV